MSVADDGCSHRLLIPDYISGGLSGDSAEGFETHLEGCSNCLEALSAAGPAFTTPGWLEVMRQHAQSDGLQVDDRPSQPVHRGLSATVEPGRIRYSWLRKIGGGGMGEVWEGWDHLMRRPVALKRLTHRNTDFEGAQRLLQEAAALSRVSHAHIVTVFELITEHGQPVLVMEHIPGLPLSAWQNARPMRPVEAAEVTLVLAQALHHAHREGVIHRDLKPSNVLLRTTSGESLPRDENGVLQLWLSDFGLARISDDPSLTCSGQLLGTPFYMAPEQVTDARSADCRTDVYGLGAILYELLTGIPPFVGNDAAMVLQLIRERDPVSPRRLQPSLSRDLENICLKCLSRRPADRYLTAAELSADLVAFLEGRPIQARPIHFLTRVVRWAARNRTIAALIASTIAALLIACLLGFVAMHEQSRMLTLATKSEAEALSAARRSKDLLKRAQAAEKTAMQRAETESQLRLRHEDLLMKLIQAVDITLRSAKNPKAPLTRGAVPGKFDAAVLTTEVIPALIDSLTEPGKPLGWNELELSIRYIALKQFSSDYVNLPVMLQRIDESLRIHEVNPKDPEDFVDFMEQRMQFFFHLNIIGKLEQDRRDWLRIAAVFLKQAFASDPSNARTEQLLDARIKALQHARGIRISEQTYPAIPRIQIRDHLREVATALAEPVPRLSVERTAEKQLLLSVEDELREFGGEESPPPAGDGN